MLHPCMFQNFQKLFKNKLQILVLRTLFLRTAENLIHHDPKNIWSFIQSKENITFDFQVKLI